MGKIKLLLGASILLLSGQVNAGIIKSELVINQFEEYTSFCSPPSLCAFGGTDRQEVLLPYFDSSLGTLDSAIIDHYLFVVGSATIDNDTTEEIADFEVSFTISGAEQNGGILFGTELCGGIGLGACSAAGTYWGGDDGDGVGVLNGGLDELVIGPFAGSAKYTDDGRFGPSYYTRDGPAHFDAGCFGLEGELDFRPYMSPSVFDVAVNASIACGAQVEYHYTAVAVPEPSAIWLLGTGLIGLIGFTKRRKAALID